MYAVGEQQKFPDDIKHTFTSRSLHLWFLLECFFPSDTSKVCSLPAFRSLLKGPVTWGLH